MYSKKEIAQINWGRGLYIYELRAQICHRKVGEPAPICQSQTQTQTPICERSANLRAHRTIARRSPTPWPQRKLPVAVAGRCRLPYGNRGAHSSSPNTCTPPSVQTTDRTGTNRTRGPGNRKSEHTGRGRPDTPAESRSRPHWRRAESALCRGVWVQNCPATILQSYCVV